MNKMIEADNSNRMQQRGLEKLSNYTSQPGRRTVSVLAALCLICLFGWWVRDSRLEGELNLPFVRPDNVIVNFLCMLPLAILLSEFSCDILKRRRFYLFIFLESVVFIAMAVVVFLVVNSENSTGTLSQYDAWESLILRPVMAFLVLFSLLLVVGNLWQTQRRKQTRQPLLCVWFLVLVTGMLIPVFYIESRVDEMVAQIEEYLGSGRLGDARQLSRQVTVLSPWAEIDNKSAVLVALDLDRACLDIERNLAYLYQRLESSEEETYHKARLHTILGESTAAIKLLEPWSDKTSASPPTLQLLGNIYQQQNNWSESERCFQRSLKAWQQLPDSKQQQAGIVSAWKGIAFAERKRGNYEAAENAYLSALSLDPKADQYFLLAQFYEDTQQTAKARTYAQQAMELNPARYETSGKRLITSLQQQHFGCLNVWRNGSP